jgi:hypothetical protein
VADDRTVNDVRVYRDSAGFYRETPVEGAAGGTGVGESGIAAALNLVLSDKRGTATLDLSKVGNVVEIAIDNGQGVLGVDIAGLSGSGATIVATSTVGLLEFPLNMARVGAGGQLPMSASEDSSWRSSVVAKTSVRIKVSVAGTGTASIAYALSTNASLIQMSAPLPPGNNRVGSVSVDNPVAVTGIFWPDVQQVAGAVSISGTVPVSGKFWQDTQPVSGSVSIAGTPTVNIGTMPAVTIGGTVTVATHAVTQSGAWSVSLASGATVAVSNLPATQQVADNGGSLTVDTGTAGVFALTPSSLAANSLVPIRNTASASLLLKAAPGNLYSAYSVAGNTGYVLMALDRVAAPAAGASINAAEIISMAQVPANGYGSISPPDIPDRFVNGCVLIASTSLTIFTAPNPLPFFNRGKVA